MPAPLLPRPQLTPLLNRWVEQGGCLGITGPSGSGRTAALRRAASLLVRAGIRPVWLSPGRFAGEPVLHALMALVSGPVSLPRGLSGRRAARAAASELVQTTGTPAWFLVDDVDQLDSFTQSTLTSLARRPGMHLICAGARVPRWVGLQHAIEPWSDAALSALVPNQPAGSTRPGPARLAAALPAPVKPPAWSARHTAALPIPDRAWPIVHAVVAAGPSLPVETAAALCGYSAVEITQLVNILEDWGLVVQDQRLLRPGSPSLRTMASLPPHAAIAQRLLHALPPDHPSTIPLRIQLGAGPALGTAAAIASLADWHPSRAASWGLELWRRRRNPEQHTDILSSLVDLAGRLERPRSVAAALREGAPHIRAAHQADLWARLGLEVVTHVDTALAQEALRQVRDTQAECPRCALLEAALDLTTNHPARALARLRGRAPSEPALRVRAAELEAEALTALARPGDALQAWATVTTHGTPAQQERAATESARLLEAAGQALKASTAWARAAGVGRAHPDDCHTSHLRSAARAAVRGGDLGAATEHLRQAVQLADSLGLRSVATGTRCALAAVLCDLNQPEEAEQIAGRAFHDAAQDDDALAAAQGALVAADIALATSDLDKASRWLSRVAAHLTDRSPPRLRARLDRRWCEIALLQGSANVMPQLLRAHQFATRAGAQRDVCRLTAMRALALARDNRRAEVGPTLERALAPLRDAGAGRVLAEVRSWAARAWMEAGELAQARDAAAHALVWAEETGHLQLRDRAQALLDRCQEREDYGTIRLDRLLEVSTRIASERDPERILSRAAAACGELVKAERAFILLRPTTGGPPVVRTAWRGDGRPPGEPSSSIVRAVLTRGREVVLGDVAERPEIRDQDSIVARRVRSAMCVPMVVERDGGPQLEGLLYVDRPSRSPKDLDRALRILRSLGAQTMVALEAARALEEAEARTRLAAEVAHDLRSPAGAIVMAGCELAEATADLPDWATETGRLIVAQAERLLAMGEQFLSARREQPERLSLGEAVSELVELLAPVSRASGRSLLLDVVCDAHVVTTTIDLQRTLSNLVHNALRHTPEGTAVTLTVDSDDQRATIAVRDQGAGISPDLLTRIFERGVTRAEGGHGLGLHIARRLAAAHGGALRVWNHPRGGAVFEVSFPRAPVVEEDHQSG